MLRVVFYLGVLGLWACAGSPSPRVVERGLSQSLPYHVVNAGETLYAISLRYERDYRELADINQLPADYRIYPGQRVYLQAPAPKPAPTVAKKPVVVSKPVVELKLPAAKPLDTPKVASPVATQSPSAPTPLVAKPSTPLKPPVSGSPNPPSVGTKPSPSVVKPAAAPIISWTWPAQGALLRRFGDSGVANKGLDIAGKQGDPVLAAADGAVVYVGSGLVGYGKLIILRHNNNFLSAYAHNDRYLVKEGESVKLGQAIAEMGSSGADREKLHFEIRHQGKPVDPLQYLPPR